MSDEQAHGMRWMHGERSSDAQHGVGQRCSDCRLVATDAWDLNRAVFEEEEIRASEILRKNRVTSTAIEPGKVVVGALGLGAQVWEPVKRRWRVSFAWYDLWVGAYWDRKRHVLYICPLPCLLIEVWL